MRGSLTPLQFASSAHPHSWFLVADNLYDQSISLYRRSSGGSLTQNDANGSVIGEWSLTNRATFLLAGFALENAIKAFLVYENPQWISNGVLARPLRSHRLVTLAEASTLIPWKKRGKAILREFERGIESWARYPCALSAAETEVEQSLTPELWSGYLKLTRAYGVELMRLLRKPWNGPHGIRGHFKFQGGYLGAP